MRANLPFFACLSRLSKSPSSHGKECRQSVSQIDSEVVERGGCRDTDEHAEEVRGGVSNRKRRKEKRVAGEREKVFRFHGAFIRMLGSVRLEDLGREERERQLADFVCLFQWWSVYSSLVFSVFLSLSLPLSVCLSLVDAGKKQKKRWGMEDEIQNDIPRGNWTVKNDIFKVGSYTREKGNCLRKKREKKRTRVL